MNHKARRAFFSLRNPSELLALMTITGNGQFQLFGIAVSTSNQIIVITLLPYYPITLLTAAATVSAVSGVDKGIKLISGWNIRLMVILLGIFLLAGPSVFIGSVFFNTSARE